MVSRRMLFGVFLVAGVVVILGCGKTYYGSGWHVLNGFPMNKISPQEAMSRAEPYLDETFELRSRNRRHSSDREPVVHVTLKGDYYYLVKDNYPSYSPNFYLQHALKVHKDTGVLAFPSSGTR